MTDLGGGISDIKDALDKEIEDRQAYDQEQDLKLQTLNGHYFPLDGYDFGKSLDVKTPVDADVLLLNTYAITMTSGASGLEGIHEGTVVKNLHDGVEFVWNSSSQTWQDWGVGNIVTAGNDHLGVVEGTVDPGDGTADGAVTVLSGGRMKTLGFSALKMRVAGKVDTQQAAADAGKALLVGADGALILGKPAETDPNVPAWAKAATKPAYTPSEVGAEPAFAKNTAFNKNFGTSGGEALNAGDFSGYMPIPADFEAYLRQYGFTSIPDEAQNMFASLLINHGYTAFYVDAPSIPGVPNTVNWCCIRFTRRGNGELLVEYFAMTGTSQILYLGSWERPRPGPAAEAFRRWNGWQRVVTDLDINTWTDLSISWDATYAPAHDIDTIACRCNLVLQQMHVSFRPKRLANIPIPIGVVIGTITYPAGLLKPSSRIYRGVVVVDMTNGTTAGVGRQMADLDFQADGKIRLYPAVPDQYTGNLAVLANSNIYGDITLNLRAAQ
jgi:hypothetical protein